MASTDATLFICQLHKTEKAIEHSVLKCLQVKVTSNVIDIIIWLCMPGITAMYIVKVGISYKKIPTE